MLRVFLDANVLFSASNSGSPIARLIDLLIERGQAVTSDFAVEEARRNVLLKRPNWSDDLSALLAQVQIVPSIQFDLPVELVAKDQPILCTAIRCGCGYLATGDRRDFGHLFGHTIEGVTVISLVTLAELLVASKSG
ncbi:MAG: DNA-binding protein [Phycisphaeraceae bacterium]|nr:DNA-binding protein [Phycisphaeraceae bacterium]